MEKIVSYILKNIFFNPFAIISIVIVIRVIPLIIKYIVYYKSSYYKTTKNSYFSVMRDTGMLGEYMTYRELKTYEADNGKFLFNLYIPKGDDATTEIDLILICSKGIFVFESKNYSGWIFGNENQSRWCQTLPNGKGRSQKEYFYNPIMQNRTHRKKLEALLSEDSQIYDAKVPVYSAIVFSNRCELKKITLTSNQAIVVNRYNIKEAINNIQTQSELNTTNIAAIYDKLYPYTQVSDSVKKAHIENIKTNKREP